MTRVSAHLSFSFRWLMEKTAGPSTALRSGRDDNFLRRGSLFRSGGCREEIFDLKRIFHPDRSAAYWRDLLFLQDSNASIYGRRFFPGKVAADDGLEYKVVCGRSG